MSMVPQVVDDKGNPLVGPPLDAVLNRVTNFAVLANLARTRKAVERNQFQGGVDARDNIVVTADWQGIDLINRTPYTRWVDIFLFNYGPNSVSVSLNQVRPYKIVRINESLSIDYTNADHRLWYIELVCNPTETATISILGKY